jgi:hypothetical protein
VKHVNRGLGPVQRGVALISALAVLPPLLMWADANSRLTRFPPGTGEPRSTGD